MDFVIVSTLFVLFIVGLVIAYYAIVRGDAGFVFDQAGPVSVSDPEDAHRARADEHRGARILGGLALSVLAVALAILLL